MNIDTERTVGEFAAEFPASRRVFEKVGIDYCCGGRVPIAEAAAKARVSLIKLEADLIKAAAAAPDSTTPPNFLEMSLAALTDYIVRKHHVFTRDENVRIAALLEKVCSVHGGRHEELLEIQRVFGTMRLELENHMLKEEQMLFPYIALMESSIAFGQPVPPAPFGTTANPVRVMLSEHDAAAEQLREIRRLTADFTPPDDACVTFKTLYLALEELESDLHEHIHLENNVLFPKAVAMEDGAANLVRVPAAPECLHTLQGRAG